MKKFLCLILIVLAGNFKIKADEGMWLPLFIDRLNYVDMQRMGLKLTAEEIYSVNKSSLKDAIVLFGNGCTGEIISSKGLLLTNHHCGYGAIQSKSSVENDYLTNGFWAKNYNEELHIPGLSVKFLIRIEDVTNKVLGALTQSMTETERNKKIKEIMESLQKEATKGTNFDASVRSFFEGNEYYLFVYQTYKDVRLTGAPPSSIGNFGGDTDNWMWPRHTGDFSLFRVYSAPDGSPAEYSDKNIPLVPKHSLPVSIKGVENNDFTMILGYPGTTERYLTSYGINFYLNQTYPTRIDIRGKKLEIMKENMAANDEVRIKYSSKYAGIANYWKNFIGTVKALKRLKVAEKKAVQENQFIEWVRADKNRNDKYGMVIDQFKNSYAELSKTNLGRIYYMEAVFGCEALSYSRRFSDLQKVLKENPSDTAKINSTIKDLRKSASRFFKDYDMETDKKLTKAMLEMYFNNVDKTQQPQYFLDLVEKNKANFESITSGLFEKTFFTNEKNLNFFLDKPSLKVLENDKMFKLINIFIENFNTHSKTFNEANEKLSIAKRLLIAGFREMNHGQKYYPDANQTMRLTYGKVLDYYPSDAVHYNYFTTLEGIIQKEDPANDEFIVPEKLKKLYLNKDYGNYGENGTMKVCFISNNDITGGNSGSPVIDGNGYLVGLAFDGNWEAMSGNICFEPELQRTINVDIRYVLFIIDKFAGADNLISEMKIIR